MYLINIPICLCMKSIKIYPNHRDEVQNHICIGHNLLQQIRAVKVLQNLTKPLVTFTKPRHDLSGSRNVALQ